MQANIGCTDDRKKILDTALAAFGRVDVLVNNAGVAPKVRADLLDMSEESFDYVVGINTKGNMFLTQLVAKQMIAQEPVDGRKGAIVNVSSCSSVVSSTNRGEYCVSKAGISMLTTLYADRLAAEGILVNEVRPGVIATDMTSTVQGKYDALIEKGTFPIARWGTPDFFTLSYPISGGGQRPCRLKMGLSTVRCPELLRGVALQHLRSVLLGAGWLKQGV